MMASVCLRLISDVGFIQPDDGSTGVFVHISAVERVGMRGLNDARRSAMNCQGPQVRQDIGRQSAGPNWPKGRLNPAFRLHLT